MLHGKQVSFAASLIFVWVLSTLAIILRFVARRMTRLRLWYDDYLCIAAYFLSIIFNGWVIEWIRDGIGLKTSEITWLSPAEADSAARRNLYFAEVFNALSISCSKLAILGLYWRLFSMTCARWPIMFLAFFAVCWLVARTTVGIVQCVPPAAFWDDSIKDASCPVDANKLIYAASMSHLGLDLLILITPMFVLSGLRLDFWPKAGVMATFMFGILVCLCAIVVIVSSLRMPVDSNGLSYNIHSTLLFANLEVNLAVVTSCLPLLRPVFKSMHQKVSRSTLSSPCSCWPCSTEHQPATASATTTEGVDPRVAVFENSFYITRPDPAPARARLERRRIRGILDSWSSLSSKVSSAATTNLSHLSRISRRKTRDSAVVVHHEGRVDDDVAERQATPGMVERQELSFIPVVTVADIEPSKPA